LVVKVTAGLKKVMAAYHRVYDLVAYGLTARKRGSAQNPTAVNGTILPLNRPNAFFNVQTTF